MQNPSPFQRQRLITIVSVLLLHVLALWGLQSGLLQRAVSLAEEMVVPVAVIPEVPAEAKPKPKPLAPAPPVKAAAVAAPAPVVPAPAAPSPVAAQAAPVPQAVADPTPMTTAPAGLLHPAPAVAATAPVPAPSPKVEMPISMADYLHNPKPPYPKFSERRGEQGVVILSVLVGVDGRAKEVSLKTSSGYERLDQAARETVLGWTFVPGKRNGLAVEMSVDVPIRFKPSE